MILPSVAETNNSALVDEHDILNNTESKRHALEVCLDCLENTVFSGPSMANQGQPQRQVPVHTAIENRDVQGSGAQLWGVGNP